MTDQTRTVPKREAELLECLAKVFAMLADAVNELADGRPDEAEELLEQLSAAESFVTTAPCVGRRATDTEVAGWKAERTKQRAGEPRPECADPHGERLAELEAKEKRLAELEAAASDQAG